MHMMARHFIATVFMMLLLLPVADVEASDARRGFYFGADVGISLPNDLKSTRTNNGIPTNCDQWLEADTLNDGTTVPLPLEQCSPRNLPGRPNNFDLGTGFLAGVNLGHAWRDFRLEAEYFRREQSGERLALNVPGDPKQAEFVERSEKISDFRTDNFFANVYYDFHNMLSAKFTPYLGVGLGVMRVQMDYSGASIRTNNETTLRDLGRNRNAAGLATLADEVLSDTLFGYQWIAGMDYAWSERFSVGLKFRYGNAFDDFKDENNAWKSLRGHTSTVGRPGTPGYNLPIRYAIQANDLSFWGLSLNLKYYFNM
ncbi:MAG: outer membrane beta-barrel protein [Nitrospira sp.]|nr:outer membrane beta-barrel protein [Nitrospira sp.]